MDKWFLPKMQRQLVGDYSLFGKNGAETSDYPYAKKELWSIPEPYKKLTQNGS